MGEPSGGSIAVWGRPIPGWRARLAFVPAWRRRLWMALAGLVSAMAAGALLALHLHRLQSSFQWVHHTEEVLQAAALVEVDMLTAESDARDYVMSGDKEFAAAFDHSRRATLANLEVLRSLVADNPQQVQRLTLVQPRIDARLQLLAELIAIGPEQRDRARQLLRGSVDLRPTTQLALSRFRDVELDLLWQRQRDAATIELRVLAIAVITVAFAAMSGLGALLLARDHQKEHLRRLQAQFEQVSRLNMIGQHASMLSHEVSQPLVATANYLHAAKILLQQPNPSHAEVERVLDIAAKQLGNASDVLTRLRKFIANKPQQARPESVRQLIDESIDLMALARLDVIVRREDGAHALPKVLVDRVQVIQVLINLVRNAVQAMQGRAERVLGFAAAVEESGLVRISVCDTGGGVPPALREQLFEPHVSAKSGGMGVGLSICRTLVEAQGGRIWSEPNPQGGTTFSFTLPVG